jgi:hypothetical protein
MGAIQTEDFFEELEERSPNIFESYNIDDGILIFKIHFDNGQFLKYLVDFIYTCVFPLNKCWIKINENGLSLDHYSEKVDKIQCSVYLNLYKTNFVSWFSSKNIVINISPKQLQKLCRNIQKKNKVILSFIEKDQITDSKFLLTIINSDINKEETKGIPFISYYSTNTISSLAKPTNFINIPYSLYSSEIVNLKKSIGTKKELVLLELTPNNLRFTSLAHGITTLMINYGHQQSTDKPSTIYLSGNIISILSKMEKMSKMIKFFQSIDNDNETDVLKISSMIDIPYFLGEIEIYIISPKHL